VGGFLVRPSLRRLPVVGIAVDRERRQFVEGEAVTCKRCADDPRGAGQLGGIIDGPMCGSRDVGFAGFRRSGHAIA
jgi:hypothetical protein